MRREIVVGSRASRLALLQTELVIRDLKERHPGLDFAVRRVRTEGDRRRRGPLWRIEGVGVFVKELEEALASGQVDLAVHSLKDVPTELGPAFELGAITKRDDPRDVLVSKTGQHLAGLPRGGRIGTGSARRAAQLRAFRRDLEVLPLRGNIDTRLRKAFSDDYDGVILAAAALLRLGWQEHITEYLPAESFLPAVGQGALAVEIRADDQAMREVVSVVDHSPTRQAVAAERAFLRGLGGGCRAPIAALAHVGDGQLVLEGLVATPDGSLVVRATEKGPPGQAQEVGSRLAGKVLEAGGHRCLEVGRA